MKTEKKENTCHKCGKEAEEYRALCEECYNEEYFACESCDEEIRRVDAMTSDTTLCEECYNDMFTICDECGNEISNDDAYRGNDNDNTYCERCYNARQAVVGLHGYAYKPAPVFFGTDEKLFLGVELEVEGDTDLIKELEKPELYFKEDGSLDEGFEVVSHPSTLAHHKGLWADTLNTLKDKGAKSFQTETCGVHVHVNKDFFTEAEKIKLGLFVYGQKKHVEHIARRASSKWSIFKNKKISEMTYSAERYEALNWQNKNTIEFRVFKGNLKPESFFSYLEFVHAACNFVKTENSITIANNNKAWELFGKYLEVNKVKYVNLVNFLKEGN